MKTIKGNIEAILNLDDDQLAVIAAITGEDITIGKAPLIGRYINIKGKRLSEKEPTIEGLHIAYEWNEHGELIRIYVGTEWHGPILAWHGDSWRNCYSHGNFGKNYSHGGTWSASSTSTYNTVAEAIAGRNFVVGGLRMKRAEMTEGPGLKALLSQLAEIE